MDMFGMMGFIFGMAGVTFGMMGMSASGQITQLRKEHESLKEELRKSGILKETSELEQD